MKGIKRHECLKPLSRDHLIALMAAQKLMKAGKAEIPLAEAVQYFLDCWSKEISIHLEDEERILPSFIHNPDFKTRLLSDHRQLRDFVAQLSNQLNDDQLIPTTLQACGEFLDAHVRFEEHDLFPHIEQISSPNEIKELLETTALVEASRNRKGD